ncbi:MAG: NAD-dependent protein deacylase [Selenomonas sp.]|nr:NAD-dependent protein deacylase [Selenomonas sp.]
MSKIDELARIIDVSSNIVFFGGAGMSTESGIPDFRSAGGIYNQKLDKRFSPEEMVSHTFLMSHPEEFFEFLFNKMIFLDAEPNNGHEALAELESKGKLHAVVTQNIDGLHQKAGSENVYELHGTIMRWYCMDCSISYSLDYALQEHGKGAIPRCTHCGGIVRPDVVLYEEALNELVIENAVRAIRNADTIIVGGTSLAVYPAAGLLDYFRGDNLVVINKTATKADTSANLLIREPIGKVLSAAVR